MRRQWITGALLLAASTATAGELSVSITDQRGAPVADAVVTVSTTSAASANRVNPQRRTKTINQVALTFVPYLQIFRPGDKVLFHNSDKTRHHVYSFSPVKSFEFMLNPGQSSPPLELDQVGVVAVGCNIHDPMITYLFISDAPWMLRTGSDGKVVFDDLPPGEYSIRAWQPRLRPGGPAAVKPSVMRSGPHRESMAFKLSLLPDPRRRASHEHSGY